MRNVSRALFLAVLLAAAALVAGACSTFNGPAWQVGDVSMSVDDLLAAYQESQGGGATPTTDAGRLDTAALAGFMSNEIQEELLTQGLASKGISVTEEDRNNAQLAFQNQAQQTGAPANPTADQIEIQAGIAALSRVLAEEEVSSGDFDLDRAARELYEQNRDSLITPGEICARFILIPAGDPLTATAAPTEDEYAAALTEAEAVVIRLTTEDFAAVSAEVSIIESELPGGDFGCQPIDAFPQEVQPIVEVLEPGVLGAPTRVEGGYLISRVDSRTPDSEAPPFEQVEDQAIDAVLSQLGQQLIGEWLLERAETADVTVDPRFGTWDAETAQVVPPEGAAEPTVPTTALTGLDPGGIGGIGGPGGIDPSELAPTGP